MGNGVCPACAWIERNAAMGRETRGIPRWGVRLVVSGKDGMRQSQWG